MSTLQFSYRNQPQSLWYRRVGSGKPLLIVHGGPGAGHDYLLSLSEMSSHREVIFYDQVGCGNSSIPTESDYYQMESYLTEIDIIRSELGLETVDLYGHSWGGWLVIEYLLTRQPSGVDSVILSSTSGSVADFVNGMEELLVRMPQEIRQAIEQGEREGTFESTAYQEAMLFFHSHHSCLLSPWPEEMVRSNQNLFQSPAFGFLNGPGFFSVTGSMRDWNRKDQLSSITLPTLITVGKQDLFPLSCARELAEQIPTSRIVQFERSSHCAHWEEKTEYLKELTQFLGAPSPVV